MSHYSKIPLITFSISRNVMQSIRRYRKQNKSIQFKLNFSSFFICSYCLKVFETLIERDNHTLLCVIDNNKQLLRDINVYLHTYTQKPIQLGKKGRNQISEIINFYHELITNDNTAIQIEVQPQPLPKPVDPRLHIPKDQNISTTLNLNKLLIQLPTITIQAACFSFLQNYTINSINRKFDITITPSNLEKHLLDKYSIQLTSQLYRDSLVCQFMEDKVIPKEYLNDIYIKISTINQNTIIWLLIYENINPFPDIEFHQPWNILAITTDKQIIHQQFQEIQNPHLITLDKNIQEMQKANLLQEERLRSLHYEQQDHCKLIELKQRKIDRLEEESNLLQLKLVKAKGESESIRSQAENIAENKLKKAKIDLDKFYKNLNQKEYEKLSQNHKLTPLEDFMGKRSKLEMVVNKYIREKDQLNTQITLIRQSLEEQEETFKKQTQHQRTDQFQIHYNKEQIINQKLCIECHTRNRQVIQYPCHHFLFCEECYIQLSKAKYFKCPLIALAQCKEGYLDKKYKLLN